MRHILHKNRFYRGKKRYPFVGIGLSFMLFLGIIGGFSRGLDALSGEAKNEQKASLENAVWRSITQCYAIEGRYPEDLAYLQKEYGLQFDSEEFLVDYQVTGANMMPDVTVIERQAK